MENLTSEKLEAVFRHADHLLKTIDDPNLSATNQEKLMLYALFKQATNGKCNGK